MKLHRPLQVGQASRLSSFVSKPSAQGLEDRRDACPTHAAFTMVEVAIALAVIGFALVAIIGILPAGLNVQKENREETVINQDAAIWMSVLRGGSKATDYLTNYVDAIEIESTEYDALGTPGTVELKRYTPLNATIPGYELVYGGTIVGLLSTPKYQPQEAGGFISNSVIAYVRAISGNVSDKAPNDNPTVRDSAFGYRFMPEIAPFTSQDTRWTNYTDFQIVSADPQEAYARTLALNMFEFRLQFRWPLRPPLDNNFSPPVSTNLGSGRQTFRTVVAGSVYDAANNPIQPSPGLYFFQAGVFQKEEQP